MADDEQLVAGIAFTEEHLVLAQVPLAETLREGNQVRLPEAGEEADVPQKRQEVGGRRHRSRPARLGGHTAEERVAELVESLSGGCLRKPHERLEDRRALGVAELVLGEEGAR